MVIDDDIDMISLGQHANVKISAYKARHTPTLNAVVTSIGADDIQDERTGEYYYYVRLNLKK